MRFRATFIAMILAGLSVAAMVYVLKREGPGTAAGDVARDLGPLEALRRLPIDDITKITLKREDEEALVFERHDGNWRQGEPFRYPMDLFSIRQLPILAANIGGDKTTTPVPLESITTTSALGLRPPRATLRFDWPDGTLTVELGRLVGGGRGYLRLAGEKQVYSVAQDLHQRAIQANPWEWRDRRIFRDVSVDADSIERVAGTDRLVLKHERGQWRVVEPTTTRSDPMALEQWLRAMESVRVASFVVDQPDDLGQFGLANPGGWLTLTTTRRVSVGDDVLPERVVQKLLIGSRMSASTNDRFAMLEGIPVVFKLAYEDQAGLFPFAQRIVGQTASGVAPSDVKAMVIRAGDDEVRLERDLEEWKATSHDGKRVDARLAATLLSQITQVRPQEIQLAPYPADRQVATITLLGYDFRPLDTVRVAKDDKTPMWIMENGDNVLRFFPASLSLRLHAQDFGLAPAPTAGNQ